LPRNLTPATSRTASPSHPARRPWPACAWHRPVHAPACGARPSALRRASAPRRLHLQDAASDFTRSSCSARYSRADSPVTASTRRTPAPTALSPRTRIRPISPVRRDMRAAAKFDRIGLAGLGRARPAPSRRRGPHRRTSRRTAPSHLPRSRRRRSSGASSPASSAARSRWPYPRPSRSSSADIGLGCETSKRSRSGETSEPFWATWCRALRAAPHAADGSPNGWRAARAAGVIDRQHDRVAGFSVPS
jgi:hypothetical protein